MESCTMCGKSFSKNESEWFCDECANSSISTWTCIRCGNEWSPDYPDERMYSDCCHPMMESDTPNDEILYCEATWKTVWPGETKCTECYSDSDDSEVHDDCKLNKAYAVGSGKLKEF